MKRTPLYTAQSKLSPKWGIFGGWELPIYYSGILKEHWTVRSAVGLFDVSHLGHLQASGPVVMEALDKVVTQNLRRLEVGRALYTPMLNPQGFILDEMILYRLKSDQVRLVVNAGNGDKILDWLQGQIGAEAVVEDLRDQYGTLALQGPRALALLTQVLGRSLEDFPRYGVQSAQLDGVSLWMARTGYTGEDGCELFVPTDRLEQVWLTLLEAGRSFGLAPIGLGARDTLRLEAGLPLGGSDLDEQATPLEARLDWTVAWEKENFVGRAALQQQKKEGIQRRLVGFRMTGAGIPRHGYAIEVDGRAAGQVTSGTFLPCGASGQDELGRELPEAPMAIGLGYVPPKMAAPGTQISIEIHGRRAEAQIVKLPFYRRSK